METITLKTPIAIHKKCSCGKLHAMIPVGSVAHQFGGIVIGWLWNCECKSTMFYRVMSKDMARTLIFKETA